MNVTLYSLLTALVVSGIFSLLLVLLSFQTTWIMKLGLWPLCVLLLLAGLRMWLPVEMPFARPVELELEKGSAWLSRPLWGELSLGEGLAFLWLLGILLLLGCLFAGWKTHQKQMEAWEEAPEEVMQLFHRCIPRGKGNVCIARDIKAPYISGFFTPIIALPPVRWPEEDLRLILLHEWQHFCDRDQWIKLVFYGFCCVFWWNPVMWLLKRQLDQLLELRCDFKVLEKLPEEERDSYYEMLLRTYRAIRTTEPGKAAEEGRKQRRRPWPRFYRHRVIQRFRLGLNFGLVGNKGRKAGRALALAALFAFVCSYAVVFQPEPWRESSIQNTATMEGRAESGIIQKPELSQMAYTSVSYERETNDWLDYYFLMEKDRIMVIVGNEVWDFDTHEVLFTLPENLNLSQTWEESARPSAVCLDEKGNLVVLFARDKDHMAWIERFTKGGVRQGEPVKLDGLDMGEPVIMGEEGEGYFLPVDQMQVWGNRIVLRSSQNTFQVFDKMGQLLYSRSGVMDFDMDSQGNLFFFTEEHNQTTLHRMDSAAGEEIFAVTQDELYFHLSAGKDKVYLMAGDTIQAFSSQNGEWEEELMTLPSQMNGAHTARFAVREDGSICILAGAADGQNFVDIVCSPQ